MSVVLVKLPKKGDLSDCNNYTGTMLLVSTPGKVLKSRILRERMGGLLIDMLKEE